MELVIIFVVVLILAIWIGAAIGTAVVLIPVVIVVGIGQHIGLNWWQSLLAAPVAMGIALAVADHYYIRHFEKHAAEFGLPLDFIDRDIEIEGKLAKIVGTAGNKVVIRKKGDLFTRRIDLHLARTKAGL